MKSRFNRLMQSIERRVIALTADEKQSRFIETNAESLREMIEDTKYNWQSFAFYEDERPVGFMMVGAENQSERYVARTVS